MKSVIRSFAVVFCFLLCIVATVCHADTVADQSWDGSYYIQNVATGMRLTYRDGALIGRGSYDKDVGYWRVRECHPDFENPAKDRVIYQIFMPGQELLFDIANARMQENNAIQLIGRTGHNVQYWYIEPNGDGSVTIASYENRNYVLS